MQMTFCGFKAVFMNIHCKKGAATNGWKFLAFGISHESFPTVNDTFINHSVNLSICCSDFSLGQFSKETNLVFRTVLAPFSPVYSLSYIHTHNEWKDTNRRLRRKMTQCVTKSSRLDQEEKERETAVRVFSKTQYSKLTFSKGLLSGFWIYSSPQNTFLLRFIFRNLSC